MSSRLDRLFLLLENGGSIPTRHAAAVQLGEIVRLHPYELDNLLDRLHYFITSKSWDTRIAASQAVQAIVSNLPKWEPSPIKNTDQKSNIGAVSDITLSEVVGHLSLKSFSIRRVLENGSYLFAADENQFELEDENDKMDPKERAAHQRLLVNQRLGLHIADAIGMNTHNLFTNADLFDNSSTKQAEKETSQKNSVVDIVQEELNQAGLKLSCRELNRAKRKAKLLSKQKTLESSEKVDSNGRKRFKSHRRSVDSRRASLEDGSVGEWEKEWCLSEFSEHLSRDLFSSSWETRHGSATALREIIRLEGTNAGKRMGQTVEQMEESHLNWLEDKAVRLVCVLALDRFGDFLSDQVVAPVRETSAQVLGCIVQHLPKKIVLDILALLHELLVWPHWGTRHGGLLGLKYLLAVRNDMRETLLTKSFTYIFKGLQDETDDVVAVAATCLVPVADDLLKYLCPSSITDLVSTLWEALLEIDDLTASTNSILMLISKLLSYPTILNRFTDDLAHLIPRFWPFLYHSNTSVRNCTLKALETLLENLSSLRKSFEGGNPAFRSNDARANTCVGGEEANQSMGILIDDTNGRDTEADTEMKIVIDGFDRSERNEIKGKEGFLWLEEVLEPLLTHIYQRALLEYKSESQQLITKIWELILENCSISNLLLVSCRLVPVWLCLLMTNSKAHLDPNLLVLAYHPLKTGESPRKSSHSSCNLGEKVGKIESSYYIGGPRDALTSEEIEERVISARCIVSSLLGNLSHYVCQPMPGVEYKPNETPILCYIRILMSYLNSRSGFQKYGSGLVIREWAAKHPSTLCHSLLKESLLNCLSESFYFEEVTWLFTRLQQDVRDFIPVLRHYKILVDDRFCTGSVLSLEQIQEFCTHLNLHSFKLRKGVFETLEGRRSSILKNVLLVSKEQIRLIISVQSIVAGALVRFRCLPEKINPVVKPLMESIKRETVQQHQRMAAEDMAFLLDLCIDRNPSPNAKIVKNLSTFLCVDDNFTPNVVDSSSNDLCSEILSLPLQLVSGNIVSLRRQSTETRRPGRPPTKSTPSSSSEKTEVSSSIDSQKLTEIRTQNQTQRFGCSLALTAIVRYFGPTLGTKLPHFVNLIYDPLEKSEFESNLYITPERCQNYINWLQLLEIVIPALHSMYIEKFESLLCRFDCWLYHEYSGVRHMASRVFSVLTSSAGCSSTSAPFLQHLVESVLPNLEVISSDPHRLGALECLYLTIEKLGFDVIPYIVLLIVPLLGRMSDPLEKVRHLATQCFATLIRLFPLDSKSSPASIPSSLACKISEERVFLDQLLDPRKIDSYQIPVSISAELRPYQQNGVNWLAFLNRYRLHGILCDEMGLGKTLQSICILAADHFYSEQEIKKGNVKIPSETLCKRGVQSLVVCPPTLTGHWYYEILRFVSRDYLDPLHYSGIPTERKKLRPLFYHHNLIIASYKIVRNEVDFFSKIKWNYIILDEGHIIKNGKTKSSKAMKELISKHRLILTGTPIQNNVLELWSLFDFLMPGFLGTERQFVTKYSKPILQSKESKSSSKEQEAGVLALEALHRQVLPFILRRLKEDVLKDLPPKITQDYYCDLSPLQERLYEDFAKSRTGQELDGAIIKEEEGASLKPRDHIFQALQYLRRVCNHPKLVLNPSHPQYENTLKHIHKSKTPLDDISHSAKLPALKQLLLDCGIGSSEETDNSFSPSTVVSAHRALIFCQLKGMLDIIENDLIKTHLPTVTYLRLDGSVPAGDRHDLVQKFNTDPSIDLLLLTTHVGGLGLNLTGADTVIFVEHDWNPMRDLQAMDRAHRIGQKRVVNIYRLITKGTLEEKIMSLQKFKMMTANSVISQENSSLLSMGTEQILDLFVLDSKKNNENTEGATSSSSSGSTTEVMGVQASGFKKALENLPSLWEESVYEEEYNLEGFLKNLKT